MKKNQETIQQIMESFDEKMKKLFNVKIRTEMAIQEVIILNDLLIDYCYYCCYCYCCCWCCLFIGRTKGY